MRAVRTGRFSVVSAFLHRLRAGLECGMPCRSLAENGVAGLGEVSAVLGNQRGHFRVLDQVLPLVGITASFVTKKRFNL